VVGGCGYGWFGRVWVCNGAAELRIENRTILPQGRHNRRWHLSRITGMPPDCVAARSFQFDVPLPRHSPSGRSPCPAKIASVTFFPAPGSAQLAILYLDAEILIGSAGELWLRPIPEPRDSAHACRDDANWPRASNNEAALLPPDFSKAMWLPPSTGRGLDQQPVVEASRPPRSPRWATAPVRPPQSTRTG